MRLILRYVASTALALGLAMLVLSTATIEIPTPGGVIEVAVEDRVLTVAVGAALAAVGLAALLVARLSKGVDCYRLE